MDVKTLFVGIALFGVLLRCDMCACGSDLPSKGDKIRNETKARELMEQVNESLTAMFRTSKIVSWNYYTDVDSEFKRRLSVKTSTFMSTFRNDLSEEARKYDITNFKNSTLQRLFRFLQVGGLGVLKEEEMTEAAELASKMKKIYSSAKICLRESPHNCTAQLEPELVNVMARSRDHDELLYVWQKWHEVVGRQVRPHYIRFVELVNKSAVLNGFSDLSEVWLRNYEDEHIVDKIDQLWQEVEPLYKKLHAFVRMKLEKLYPGKMPADRTIPAHLLGNMWAQSWQNLLDRLNATSYQSMDVTEKMKLQKWDAIRIFKTAEDFFVSLGLPNMTRKFWERSMLKKPEDRNVVCHASAWNFFSQDDFRIKQCTDITQRDLFTAHHEMGHVMYYMMYVNQPVLFKSGANEGFHEAVGDVMSLSVQTPQQLKYLGLLDDLPNSKDATVQFQLSAALKKVAFLPFGYLLDKWRWTIFKGKTTEKDFNRKFWEMRIKYQGISPPVNRTEEDFDAGAKYHVPANVPYLRYFVSTIIQFQFHKHLCQVAGHTGPLHECNIYRSKEAGKVLRQGLSLGASKKWEDAFQILAGTRTMSASALKEYFRPLEKFLDEQVGHKQIVGWNDANVQDYYTSSQERLIPSPMTVFVLLSAAALRFCVN